MRHHLQTAILATLLLTAIVLSPVFGQGLEQRVGVFQGNIGAFKPANPPEIAPAATTPETPAQSVGPQGPQGEPGPPGRDGKTSVRTHTREIRTVVGHQGHQKPYQHIKTWNPASCSYVDARIAKGLTQGTPSSHPHNWGWLWWLLPVLLLLACLGWVIRKLCRLWHCQSRPRPDLVNSAGGNLFGVEQTYSQVPLKFEGLAARVIKGILLGKPGDPWTWIMPGQQVPPFSRKLGEVNRFCIAVENLDHFPMPTDYIRVRDELASRFPHVVERASLWVGKEKLRDLTEDERRALTLGQPFPLKRYIDFVPVGEAVHFKYDVRATGTAGTGQVISQVTGTGDDDGAPAVVESEFKLDEIMARRQTKEAKAEVEAKAKAAEKPGGKPAEIARPAEVRVEAEKPKPEATPESPIDRIRKEVLRGDYRIPDDFRGHLEGLGTEAKIREAMEAYYHTRGRLIGISNAAGQRPDYRKIGELAAKVAMGQMTVEEAEKAYQPVESPTGDIGTADQAKAGLLSGLRGGGQ